VKVQWSLKVAGLPGYK